MKLHKKMLRRTGKAILASSIITLSLATANAIYDKVQINRYEKEKELIETKLVDDSIQRYSLHDLDELNKIILEKKEDMGRQIDIGLSMLLTGALGASLMLRKNRNDYKEESSFVNIKNMVNGYRSVKQKKGERDFEYKIEDENGISRKFVIAEHFEGHYLLYERGEWGKHLFGIEHDQSVADERLRQKVSEILEKIKIQQEHQAHHGIGFD